MKVMAYDLKRKLNICEDYILKIIVLGASEEDLNKKRFTAKDLFWDLYIDWNTIKFILKSNTNIPMWSIQDVVESNNFEILETLYDKIADKKHNMAVTITPKLIEIIGKKYSTKMNFIIEVIELLGYDTLDALEDYLKIEDGTGSRYSSSGERLASELETTLSKMTWKKLSEALYQIFEKELEKVRLD